MAKSKFEYVKQFERDDVLLQNCWVVIRLDGRSFHRFSTRHQFEKPNDDRALKLLAKAEATMLEFKDIVFSYGQSDEISFVLRRCTRAYNRRGSKLLTCVLSFFTASYSFYWNSCFQQPMEYPASFDGRVVLYPSDQNLRDYLSWRQADCHINNMYNYCFWKLVQVSELSPSDAEKRLCGTTSADKNELLFSTFGINYNDLPELHRKGTVQFRGEPGCIVTEHTDIIRPDFWNAHPTILSS